MPTGLPIDSRKKFVPRFLPWLLAAAMLAVYVVTLNHWVSLFNLVPVAKISGWMWQPDVFNPIMFLVVLPLHWVPVPTVPFVVNLFSAVCAALTLGLLARSVAILPHDRTDAQRAREKSDFSFLTIRSAWLPPVLAVAVCGLQLTFWEHATNFTGEMLDLLLFAFVIWLLLEYRMDEREGRLYLAALVYGGGMAENSAMVGFFPVFLTAIIWSRGFGFFNLHFLSRMALCGLAGMLLYLLLPLLTVISGKLPITFWEALKFNLTWQSQGIKRFFGDSDFRVSLGLLSINSLLPLLLVSIRWPASFGDKSQVGQGLASFVFHLMHGLFLAVCVWIAFDPQVKICARHSGYGLPFLTFYYLGGLCIGYFCGYFLLVFGKKEAGVRGRQPSPLDFLKHPAVNGLIVACVWLLAILAVVGLVYRNAPQIRATNGDTLHRYAALAVEKLPRTGGFLLSDDAQRLTLAQVALVQAGRTQDFVPVDTQSLSFPAYHRFLHRKYPHRWPELVSATQTNMVNPFVLGQVVDNLSLSNDLYYLHPSFGYYFERFYQEPHGLVYKLKPLPAETLLPPLPDKELIAENEMFWSQAATDTLPPVEKFLSPTDPNAQLSFGERMLRKYHVPREPSPNAAAVAGTFYSHGLDFWGVELQRVGEFEKAAGWFDAALKLNPDNVVAQINLDFNKSLRTGAPATVDLSKATSDQFGKYGTWKDLVNANGPFDEPSFCFANGQEFADDNQFYRQAIASFNRVRELAPDNLPARMRLAQLYLLQSLPGRALEVLNDPLNNPGKFSLGETNSTYVSLLAAEACFQLTDYTRADELLMTEIARHPGDDNVLTIVMQAFMVHSRFESALQLIDSKLKSVPNDPIWLYGRGYVCIQLKDYDGAIAALTHVLTIQTNNEDAIFNRAISNLAADRLDAARADYLRLQQAHTNAFQIAYGLGEIAWRRHETNEAIRNYEIYLANANTNSGEAKIVRDRLNSLKR
jgi:tetratricopeptide (TPR) repeat protein